MKPYTAASALLILALTVSMAQAAPVHQGTILASLPTGSPTCNFSPNCVAFRTSGCDVSFVQADNGVASSIVDVGNIKGTQRVFRTMFGSPTGSSTLLGSPGFGLGFYTTSCAEVDSPTPIENRITIGSSASFKIPSNAKWMVVTANALINAAWTLT